MRAGRLSPTPREGDDRLLLLAHDQSQSTGSGRRQPTPTRTMPFRLILPLALAALTVTATAPAGSRGTSSSRYVHRGEIVRIGITLDSEAVCIAAIQYAHGQSQSSGTKYLRDSRVSWSFRVPTSAGLGRATWNVRCGVTWSREGSFIVLAARATVHPGGSAPRVVVASRGYSQRPDRTDAGSAVSYGLLLRNTSASEDAVDLYVLVNFVGADGRLIASKPQTVGVVRAGQTYALGNSVALPGQSVVTRLEVAVQVRAHHPKQPHPKPAVASLRIVASTSDPEWVGEVDGEVVNGSSRLVLSRARLSIVLRDGAGNIVGGGTGSIPAALPPSTRIAFGARSGFSSVPLDQAVTPVVSVEPTYLAP